MLLFTTAGSKNSRSSAFWSAKVRSVVLLTVFLSSLIAGFLLASSGTQAQANDTINFQSKIVDKSTGLNVTTGTPACVLAGADTCDFRFSIYTDSTGGTLLWREPQADVELGDVGGLFNIELNSVCSSWDSPGGSCSGSGLDWGNDSTIYLEVELDTDGDGDYATGGGDTLETFARKVFTSVPYAYYADTAGQLDGIDSTGFVQYAPSAAQTSGNTTNPLIFLNENGTGTANLVQIQVGGTDAFTIANSGEVYTADDLLVGGTSSTISTGFSLGGDDLYVAGLLGVEGAIYTDDDLYLQTDVDTTGAGDIAINFGGTNTESLIWSATDDAFVLSDDFLPSADDAYDLGTTDDRWRDLYLGPTSLHIGVDGNEAVISYNTTNQAIEFSDEVNVLADFIYAAADASGAQMNLVSSVGVNPSTPGNGDLWYNGTNLYFYDGGSNVDLLSGLFSDGGAISYLTSVTDDLALGGSTSSSPFYMDVDTNTLRIGDGVSDANDPTLIFYASDATNSGSLSYLDADGFYFSGGDVSIGASAETLDNTGFVMGGDDMFIAGMLGIEGNVYTDGEFITGTTLTLGDGYITQSTTGAGDLVISTTGGSGGILGLSSNTNLEIKADGNSSDYIYYSEETESAETALGQFWEGVQTYTNDPGIRVNADTGELEYRDEDESDWTTIDSLVTGTGDVTYGDAGDHVNITIYGDIIEGSTTEIYPEVDDIVDIFIYDTNEDSNTGTWTNSVSATQTSWYTETLDDATVACNITTHDRCGTPDFPKKAILIATENNLYIFSGIGNQLWMKFSQGTGYALDVAANNDITGVEASNGKVYVSTSGSSATGVYEIDFVADTIIRTDSEGTSINNSNIANRNSSQSYSIKSTNQSFSWVQRETGAGHTYAEGTATDSDGNVYVVGYFSSTIIFGPDSLTASGTYDMFIVKFDKHGEYLWSDAEDSGSGVAQAWGVAVDSNDDVYVGGEFSGTVDFGAGSWTSTGDDYFVVKYNSSGTYQWADREDSGSSDANAYGIATDTSNNVLVTGVFAGTVDFGGGTLTSGGTFDYFVLKYNSSGTYQWADQEDSGSGNAEGLAIATDSNNNVYVTGYFDGTVDVGAGSWTSSNDDYFVVKYNSTGTYQWADREDSGTGSLQGYGITVDLDDNITLCTYHYGSADYGDGTFNAGSSFAYAVVRYNASGTYQWSKFWGTGGWTVPHDIVSDQNNNFYVGGMFRQGGGSGVDVGVGAWTTIGDDDFFVVKFDVDGNPLWGTHEQAGSGHAETRALSVSEGNDLYVTGRHSTGAVDFGSGLFTVTSSDLFLVRYEALNISDSSVNDIHLQSLDNDSYLSVATDQDLSVVNLDEETGIDYSYRSVDITQSANAIESAHNGAYVPGNAFDDSSATQWRSAQTGAGVDGVSYIGQDFGSGNAKAIRKVGLEQYNNAAYIVTSALVQYSDDASCSASWTTATTISPVLSASNIDYEVPDSGAHRCWRLLANSATGSSYWIVEEITMLEDSLGYSFTWLKGDGKLYGISDRQDQIDVWNDVQDDAGGMLKTLPDTVYNSSSTPAVIGLDNPNTLYMNNSILYVGTDSGLIAVNENVSGVKHYTTDYISEWMVGDTQGSWAFDGAVGSTLVNNTFLSDVSIASNSLEVSTSGGTTSYVSGVRGAGILFDGTSTNFCADQDEDNICDTTGDFSVAADEDMSVGVWFKTNQDYSSEQGILLSRRTTTGVGWEIGINTSNQAFCQADDGADQTVTSTDTVNDNNWHHIVFVRNDSVTNEGNCYLDGENIGSMSGQEGAYATAIPFKIGAIEATTDELFSGTMDEPFFTKHAIPGNVIKDMYESGIQSTEVEQIEIDNADVTSVSTIGDSSLNVEMNEYRDYIVEITTGTGAGQTRTISSNTSTTFTIYPDWSTTPDATSDFKIRPNVLYGASDNVTAVSVYEDQLYIAINDSSDGGGVTVLNKESDNVNKVYQGLAGVVDSSSDAWDTTTGYDDINALAIDPKIVTIGSDQHFWFEYKGESLIAKIESISNSIGVVDDSGVKLSHQIIRTGWGYVQGNNTSTMSVDPFSYGISYDEPPMVFANGAGYADEIIPSSLGDCDTFWGRANLTTHSITNSTFSLDFRNTIEYQNTGGAMIYNTFNAADAYCYTWMAIGTYTNNSGADLAENYLTYNLEMEAGDVVSIDLEHDISVQRTEGKMDINAIGIVATQPQITLGPDDGTTPGVETSITGEEVESGEAKTVPIALAGRVPVKVTLENGEIHRGDFLTPSSTPGYAMRATEPGISIGRALTDFDGTSTIAGVLSADVEIGEDDLQTAYDENYFANSDDALERKEGKVMAFVQTGYYWGQMQSSVGGEDIQSVASTDTEQVLGIMNDDGTISTDPVDLNSTITMGLEIAKAYPEDSDVIGSFNLGKLLLREVDSSLNSVSEPLRLQTISGANIEFFNGLYTFTADGLLSAPSLEVGRATIDDLTVQRITVANGNAGTIEIPAYVTSMRVEFSEPINGGYILLVTPTADDNAMIPNYHTIKESTYFEIRLEQASAIEGVTVFDYLIVNTVTDQPEAGETANEEASESTNSNPDLSEEV